MTIQATFTTLTLSVSLISGSWTLASAESTAGDLANAVPVQFEEATPLFLGAEPPLPIETVARRIAADPLWGHSSILQDLSSPRGGGLLDDVAGPHRDFFALPKRLGNP